MLLSVAIQTFSEGIALAEGFYVAGSLAARNHNPGNLTLDITGTGVGMEGGFVKYANDSDGWEALRKQVELILTNASQIYNNNMTLRQIGEKYASTSPPDERLNWAINVASKLGIGIDTPVSTLLETAATVGIGLGILIVFGLLWYFTKEKK
jgi:hypothetical protein